MVDAVGKPAAAGIAPLPLDATIGAAAQIATCLIGSAVTGELSPDEFEIAASEFVVWWAARVGECRGSCGGCGAAPLPSCEQRAADAKGNGDQQQQRQRQRHEGGSQAEDFSWFWVAERQPVTGEEVGYLAGEAPLPWQHPQDTCNTHDTQDGRPAAAAPRGASAATEASGGDGGGAEVDEEDALSQDDDEAAISGVAGPAAETAGGAPSGRTPRVGGGAARVLDLHIAYQPSYRVPLLLFRARHVGGHGGAGAGGAAAHRELLELLAEPLGRHADASVPGWAYVAQMPHPALREPWAALHPCQTAALMRLMLSPGGGGGGGGGGGCSHEAAGAAAGMPRCKRGALLLHYMIAWFSVFGRAVGVRPPGPAG